MIWDLFCTQEIDCTGNEKSRFYSFTKKLASIARLLNKGLGVVFLSLIWLYRKIISPVLPNSCRFTPSCSEYAMQAVKKYGAVKGLGLAAKRIAKCHPFHPGGFDPVP